MTINKEQIQAAVDQAAGIAEVIAPQYAAFIVLGQAFAHAAPELYEDVKRLLSKEEPTDAEVEKLTTDIQSLLDPAAL